MKSRNKILQCYFIVVPLQLSIHHNCFIYYNAHFVTFFKKGFILWNSKSRPWQHQQIWTKHLVYHLFSFISFLKKNYTLLSFYWTNSKHMQSDMKKNFWKINRWLFYISFLCQYFVSWFSFSSKLFQIQIHLLIGLYSCIIFWVRSLYLRQ